MHREKLRPHRQEYQVGLIGQLLRWRPKGFYLAADALELGDEFLPVLIIRMHQKHP